MKIAPIILCVIALLANACASAEAKGSDGPCVHSHGAPLPSADCGSESDSRQPVPIPSLEGRVTDQVDKLSLNARDALEAELAAFETETGSQIAILVVPTTKPETIEQYCQRLADTWKIGRVGEGNGILIVVAIEDHRLRIAVGFGLENVLPDSKAQQIINNLIVPAFKKGNFDRGIADGTHEIMRLIRVSEARKLRYRNEQNTSQAEASKSTPEMQLAKDDGARGYNQMSFNDFELDAEKMPLGKKLAITGYYQVEGQLEMLVDTIFSKQVPGAYRLILITDEAPRPTRKELLTWRKSTCGMYGMCLMTVLGHVSECEVNWLGRPIRNTRCLTVDSIRAAN